MEISNVALNLEVNSESNLQEERDEETQSEILQKTKQRSVLTVIHYIIKEIPDDEERLIEEILDYSQSLWNKAPEVLIKRECWFPLQCILSKYILDFDTEWKIKVLAVFNGF